MRTPSLEGWALGASSVTVGPVPPCLVCPPPGVHFSCTFKHPTQSSPTASIMANKVEAQHCIRRMAPDAAAHPALSPSFCRVLEAQTGQLPVSPWGGGVPKQVERVRRLTGSGQASGALGQRVAETPAHADGGGEKGRRAREKERDEKRVSRVTLPLWQSKASTASKSTNNIRKE